MGTRHRRGIHGEKHFDPREVPEVAAGYWWDASLASGFGTANFRVPEGGGHSTFDQLQSDTAKQATLITGNGSSQLQLLGDINADSSPDIRMITAGNVAAGWGAGNTYLAMWLRYPGRGVANDLVAGNTFLFRHETLAAGKRRINLVHNGTNDTYSLTVSPDGTATQANTWDASVDYPDPSSPNLWMWKEWILTAGVGATMSGDFVLRSTASAAITSGALFDCTEPLALFSSTSGAINQNTQQCGPLYYANGIPSLANRVRLANYKNPTAILLSA